VFNGWLPLGHFGVWYSLHSLVVYGVSVLVLSGAIAVDTFSFLDAHADAAYYTYLLGCAAGLYIPQLFGSPMCLK
jgi:hypothetical protein